MKFVAKKQATQHHNSSVCEVYGYNLQDEQLDFAIAKITGRYPDTNYVVNEKCKEVVYIQEGSGSVTINGKEYRLEMGDVVLIEAGEKFCWDGNMILFISCRPAWFPDQHKKVSLP